MSGRTGRLEEFAVYTVLCIKQMADETWPYGTGSSPQCLHGDDRAGRRPGRPGVHVADSFANTAVTDTAG